MKKMRWLLLVAVVACHGCSALTWAEYPLKDSGRVANSASDIYWVDDHRVLFQGHFWNADGSIKGPGGVPKNSETLYEWDIESGALTEHGDIGGGLCYANGYVRYWRRNESDSERSRAEWIAGELGRQARIDSLYITVDRETCKARSDDLLPEWTQGKAVLRLRADHGFLVLGEKTEDRNTPVTYHPKGVRSGVVMPFRRREARLASIKYVPFKDAYLITGDYFISDPHHPLGGYNRSPWPKEKPMPVWWLRPDGTVTEINLHNDTRFGVWIFAMRPGLFFISPGASVNMDGLFFTSEATVKRIVKGFIDRYAVSPDGCKIAINHSQISRPSRPQGTLKVVDLCKEGN